jgi:hypothetical protein
MSKPREFAHLIKNKFGSADNINSLGKSSFYTGEQRRLFCTLESQFANRVLSQGIEESGGSEEDQNSQQSQRIHHGSATLPANASSHQHSSGSAGGRFPHGSEEGASECSSATSESLPPHPQHNQHNQNNQNTNLSNSGDAGTTPQQAPAVSSPRRRGQLYSEVLVYKSHDFNYKLLHFCFQSAGSIDVSRIVEEVQTLREELTSLKTDFDALKVI